MKNRILVIIVTYNGLKWVDRCLGSVRDSVMPADVIVIDNGSGDGTSEYISERFPEIELVRTGENLGFGNANNIGFRHALENGYEYVYLLNQDAWIYPDTFGKLTDAMESDRSLGILSPMQLTAAADRPDPRFARWCPENAMSEWRAGAGGVHETGFVMAAHWMISRECLMKVGAFSPAFGHYGEDDNYIHRARYKGYRIGIHSGALSVHDREIRPMSRKAAMRLKCVASVVKLSNPLSRLWFRMVFQPLELLAISLRYGSWSVFSYIFTFIGSYGRLKSLRAESLEDGAFLGTVE